MSSGHTLVVDTHQAVCGMPPSLRPIVPNLTLSTMRSCSSLRFPKRSTALTSWTSRPTSTAYYWKPVENYAGEDSRSPSYCLCSCQGRRQCFSLELLLRITGSRLPGWQPWHCHWRQNQRLHWLLSTLLDTTMTTTQFFGASIPWPVQPNPGLVIVFISLSMALLILSLPGMMTWRTLTNKC